MDQFPQFECEDGKQTWFSSETTGPSVREVFVLFGLDDQANEGCYCHHCLAQLWAGAAILIGSLQS